MYIADDKRPARTGRAALTGSGAVAVALAALLAGTGPASASTRPPYGCYAITVDALNIRARPFSNSRVIAEVAKGDILIKRRSYCTLRGFWCAVATEQGVAGFADKSMLAIAPCPARLSR